MIALGNAALKIYVALEPCDLRKSFDGLFAVASGHLAGGRLGCDMLFVFANKRRERGQQSKIKTSPGRRAAGARNGATRSSCNPPAP